MGIICCELLHKSSQAKIKAGDYPGLRGGERDYHQGTLQASWNRRPGVWREEGNRPGHSASLL